MKYKVSLLPESRKKQINARKMISKIKGVALTVVAVLLAFYVVVFATNVYASFKLKEARELDAECVAEIEQLASYRDIHSALQQRVALFDKIKVAEPQLYEFIYEWSGIDHPGVSINKIECTNWKTDRLCTIVGSCDSRQQYLDYEEALTKLTGVTSVSCVEYASNVGSGEDAKAGFTISVSVSGGVPVVETTVPVVEATTAAAE